MRYGLVLKLFTLFLWGINAPIAVAQPSQSYFPDTVSFDQNIPKPERYLGFDVGSWHVSPDALTGYMRHLAQGSERVYIETIGYSHERHALSHVFISSPENIASLDERLLQHQSATSAADDILVLNLAYSVHGNEPSGSNAAMLVAYYLAASQEQWVKDFLAKTIIIIDPTQNPDGLGRHANFANQHKGATENLDPADRTHFEGWPSGRTNHYWFDLNRDWIFGTQPESVARIKAYQKWRPHVLGDYHEMGGDFPTYFFQPGHPDRTHPLTSEENQRITMELAKFHAKALDSRAQPFITQERFDDFYYGKASAYPDAMGAIGLLFEQSAVRGHVREFGGVKIRFRDAVANHLATSLSLMKGADANRDDILAHRFNAMKRGVQLAAKDPVKAYVFADDGDPARAKKLLDILALHQIPVYGLNNDIRVDDDIFRPGYAWAVKMDGAKYGLIRSLFETRTSFGDTIFYDVSSWNLPLALNLPFAPLRKLKNISTDLAIISDEAAVTAMKAKPVAYAFEWNQYRAPHLLQALLSGGLKPRLMTKDFAVDTEEGNIQKFKAGTIVIHPKTADDHENIQQIIAEHSQVRAYGLASGLTVSGPDMGSSAVRVLNPIKAAILVGPGVNPSEAGEVRFALDQAFSMPVTILDADRLSETDLTYYSHILMVDGRYKQWGNYSKILQKWVQSGGVIIAQKNAATWLEKTVLTKNKKAKTKAAKQPEKKIAERRSYQDYEQDRGKSTISGAVLWAKADLTHPLMFGFERAKIPLFYNARSTLSVPKIPYDIPLIYGDKSKVLAAGYADQKLLDKIAGTPAIALHRVGTGKIVLFSNNVNFRAIWIGTERLYANALFFTQAVEGRRNLEQ